LLEGGTAERYVGDENRHCRSAQPRPRKARRPIITVPRQIRAQQLIGDFVPQLVDDLTHDVLFGDIWERTSSPTGRQPSKDE
jgi:hypothetical protein